MTYSKTHRFMLRTIASRGVLSLSEAQELLLSFSGQLNTQSKQYNIQHSPHVICISSEKGNEEEIIDNIVKEINEHIRPFQQSIKIANDELTNERVVIFLSLGFDDATKSQNIFSATELEFFRILIEEIMSTETRQISSIHAMNLVTKMKSTFTKSDAQKLLAIWCRMRYLDKAQNEYALGVRTIHEFESYLRQNMPDVIEECTLCKQIVFRGCNCPACGLAVHTRCMNRYLEKIEKWPCCKVDYDASHVITNRLTQTQILETEEDIEEVRPESPVYDTIVESTQNVSTEYMDLTQETVMGISQAVTRKRKRQWE